MTMRAPSRLSSALALMCLSLGWNCANASAEPQSPKTVLTVHWSSEDSPSNVVVDDSIREVLLAPSDTPVDYFAEYLESDRFPEEDAALTLRDYIRQKYRGRHIDLVFAVSEVSLKFVLRFRDELFPGAPVVYSGIGIEGSDRTEGAGLTGVVRGLAYQETLALALRLHPSVTQVLVVAQAPAAGFLDSVQRELSAFEKRVTLTYLTGLPVPSLLEAVTAAPPRSLVLYIRYSREDPGQVLFPRDVARLVVHASPVPTYGISDSYVGTGIVGGAVYSQRALGNRLGVLGRQILDGHRPTVTLEHSRTVRMFDWRQVERWHIDPASLPIGSDVRFKEPTAWDKYRWNIVGAIVLAVLQTLMIAALVVERSRRRHAQTRYALATAAGGVGVWDWNLETNAMHMDASLKATLGYDDHEIRNRFDDLSRMIHPDDAPGAMARARELAEGTRPGAEMELRMLHRDGSARWFLSRGSRMRRNGRTAHVTGTYIDITERKLSERALDETQAELTRVSRLAALGEFAASIAHEVRQPLTSIIMNAKTCLRWLAEPTPNLTEIREALDDVVDAGKRANELVQRNRELFKQRTVQKELLDIHDVIREVAVLGDTRLQRSHVALATSFGPDVPAVFGDRIELEQVLMNLIANSLDATECLDPDRRRIEVSTDLTPAGLVRVSVRDNGVGLAGVDMRRIFSLSYTTKADGTGIGLSLSRSIVEAHGGRLWAEPNLDCGATFSFTLPVHARRVSRPGLVH